MELRSPARWLVPELEDAPFLTRARADLGATIASMCLLVCALTLALLPGMELPAGISAVVVLAAGLYVLYFVLLHRDRHADRANLLLVASFVFGQCGTALLLGQATWVQTAWAAPAVVLTDLVVGRRAALIVALWLAAPFALAAFDPGYLMGASPAMAVLAALAVISGSALTLAATAQWSGACTRKEAELARAVDAIQSMLDATHEGVFEVQDRLVPLNITARWLLEWPGFEAQVQEELTSELWFENGRGAAAFRVASADAPDEALVLTAALRTSQEGRQLLFVRDVTDRVALQSANASLREQLGESASAA